MADGGTLKPGWTKVKFGEVVRLCKDRSSDPEADGIERYVGLEHLEPEDLRIRSWGLVAEGTTFTSRFKPGQVLFGKRRAYQRKVAVADFEGVCSGDIYVLESSDSKYLLPELLPFICQTDQFFEYAVGTSAGSLSPRTNWKQLQNFKLFLPALDEQYQILQFLQGIEKSIHSHEDTERCSKCLTSSILKNVLLPSKPDWKKYTLESILSRVIDYRGRTLP
jgi:type I restriction enzyme S subunit